MFLVEPEKGGKLLNMGKKRKSSVNITLNVPYALIHDMHLDFTNPNSFPSIVVVQRSHVFLSREYSEAE